MLKKKIFFYNTDFCGRELSFHSDVEWRENNIAKVFFFFLSTHMNTPKPHKKVGVERLKLNVAVWMLAGCFHTHYFHSIISLPTYYVAKHAFTIKCIHCKLLCEI